MERGMRYVSRRECGLRAPKRVNRGTLSKPCTGHWNGPKVTIGGKTTWDHAFCSSIVRNIQKYHMDFKGWNDIAYNFVVCPHGYVFEGRGINVWNGANGTNVGNQTSHAVMWMSGTGNPFTDGEKQGFIDAVDYIAQNSSAPSGTAIGHRDHKSTECPGDDRYSWIIGGMKFHSTAPQEDDMQFHSHEARVAFVERAYDRVVGRSKAKGNLTQEEIDTWVWYIAHNAMVALDLMIELEREQRLSLERKITA